MATLREAVIAWLQSDTTLTAISPRIYFALPSQMSLYPCTVFEISARSYEHNLAGADGISRATLEITSLSLLESQCIAMAEAIRNVMDGFRGTQSGVAIVRNFLVSEVDDQTPPPDGSDQWIYWCTLEYRCDHRVPLPTSVTQTNV